jgi:hypothetical protein
MNNSITNYHLHATNELTHSMEQSPSWEAGIHSAVNSKDHYHIHMNLPLDRPDSVDSSPHPHTL